MTEADRFSPAPGELPPRRIAVLLIDDQPMVGEAVRRMLLSETDIDFHFCTIPEQAIATAREVHPTVILQDLVMPGVDGLDLVQYFRDEETTRNIPLLVLSSEENARVKAASFERGANDYLIKLPAREELIARIRYHSNGYIHWLERNDAFEAIVRTQEHLAAELAEAADYVQSLLPPPLSDPIATSWKFIPSTSLGGDGFGYHWLDDDHFAIYLLDVAGHGVGAALLSVSVLEELRSQNLPHTDFYNPADVLHQLNRSFQMREHNQKFFTIWYGIFDRRTRELTYATGGHPPAILLHGDTPADATRAELKAPGAMIGGLDNAEYTNAVITVKAWNCLYIFSDGTFEIILPDDSMWDFQAFLRVLTTPDATGHYPDVDRIHAAIAAVKGDEAFDDDFSLLRIVFPPENAR